jgi:hypothetical protein
MNKSVFEIKDTENPNIKRFIINSDDINNSSRLVDIVELKKLYIDLVELLENK